MLSGEFCSLAIHCSGSVCFIKAHVWLTVNKDSSSCHFIKLSYSVLQHDCYTASKYLKCYTMKTLLEACDLGNYCWDDLNLGGVWFLSTQRNTSPSLINLIYFLNSIRYLLLCCGVYHFYRCYLVWLPYYRVNLTPTQKKCLRSLFRQSHSDSLFLFNASIH